MRSNQNPDEGVWIRFEPAAPAPKTLRWSVVNKSTGEPLGMVSWFGRWRRYAFSPESGTVLEHQCLADIADFCVRQTKDHRLSSGRSKVLEGV